MVEANSGVLCKIKEEEKISSTCHEAWSVIRVKVVRLVCRGVAIHPVPYGIGSLRRV